MVDTFHKPQQTIRAQSILWLLSMLVFRYNDYQEGSCSRVFLSRPCKEALELFQPVGPKVDGRVFVCSPVPPVSKLKGREGLGQPGLQGW